MPFGDGTGPLGQGPGTGRGRGRRGGNRAGASLSGFCVCPGCGAKVPHQVGVSCSNVSCPKCGTKML